MKRLLTVFAVVIVATAVSFGLVRWTMARQPTSANLHDTAWLTRQLNLTHAQAVEVQKIEAAFRVKLDVACGTHCSARMALGDEIAKPKPDTEKCRAAVEKMNAVQADCERATLEHIMQVRSLLDEHQAQRYSTLIRDLVCNMPMGAP